jgi:hypothetical protein
MDMEHWRITAWELFATVVFLVLEFYFLWYASHRITWIVATVTVAVSLLLVFPWPVGLVLFFLAVGVGGITFFYLPPNETEFHGWLVPANDPNPAIPPPCKPSPDATLVYLGSSLALAPNDLNEIRVVVCHGDNLLEVRRREDGGLDVDAKIFDEHDRIVAVVERGEFTINKNNVFRVKHPDRHTLEVIDQHNQTALHIKFLNPRAIYVTGIFIRGTDRMTVGDTELVINNVVHWHGGCLGNPGKGRPIMEIH